jgi:ankyrin repeat protein
MSIHEAAEDGREEELQKLILRNIQAVNEEDEYGETPLHLACMAGHPNCVKLLLHNGAEVPAPSPQPPPRRPFNRIGR